MDGAARLGRNALILSVISILGGVAIIAAACALNWGGGSCDRGPLHTLTMLTHGLSVFLPSCLSVFLTDLLFTTQYCLSDFLLSYFLQVF